MSRHEGPREDRNGNKINNVRERLPNGQKKRLKYNVTFCDTVKDEN